MQKNISGKRLAWLLSFLYFVSYVTRINLAAIIQEVITETGFSKSQLSVILVCISVSYGVGQIINGRIGDKIPPQNLILIGLCIISAANLLLPSFSYSVFAMSVLWTLNGFAQAMLWPPMVKIMVSTMDDITYSNSVVTVFLGSSIGTILIYLISPLIIKLSGWKTVIYTSAIIGLIGTVIWLLLKERCYNNNVIKADSDQKTNTHIPKSVISPFILIAFGIILHGMIRDSVTAWMPTYLSETVGLDSEKSIFLTVSLAIFSLLFFVFTNKIYKRYFINEVSCATVIYLFTAVCSIVLLLFFGKLGVSPTVLLLALISGGMHGVNLMLISHVPKRFSKYGNISTISGFINSFTYIGSAIATYGIAKISEVFGWKITIGVWALVLVLGTLSCLVAIPKWKKFIEC